MAEPRTKVFAGDRPFSRAWLVDNALIVLGCALAAFGYVFFIIPHDIVPGGVVGLSQVLNRLLGVPIGLTALAINLPVLGLATRLLGPRFGLRTVLAMVLLSLFIDGMLRWHGREPVTDDRLVSTIFGAVLIGTGIASVIRSRANVGGTALAGQLLGRLLRVQTGRAMLLIDAAVVGSSILAFGELDLAPYALIAIWAITRTVDAVLTGLDASKAVLIISEHHERIRETILTGLDRGGTYLNARGLFHPDQERQVIFSALSPREAVALQRRVKDIDPGAFLMVFDVREVIGSGFKPWH